ncbi:MAG: hypothetical protein QME81_10080 [bacterium]|nr:hypothetical protein [bacterium]
MMDGKNRVVWGAFILVILVGVCSSVLCFYLGVGRCELFHFCDDVVVKTEALDMMRDGKTEDAIRYLERSLDNQIPGLQRQTRVKWLASCRDKALSLAKAYVSKYDAEFSKHTLAFIRGSQ